MVKVTRFAPSPTGYLHVGHAFSALFAMRAGERFLLMKTLTPSAAARNLPKPSLLTFNGLGWTGRAIHQSTRFAVYQAALDRLQGDGLLYPCFCTRQRQSASGGAAGGLRPAFIPAPVALCPRHYAPRNWPEANLTPCGWMPGWRGSVLFLRCAGMMVFAGGQEAERSQLDDVVLARSGRGSVGQLLPASYHLCVTVDDAAQGITLVTRGEDLFDSTPVHRLLQHLLDLPVPAYHHHPLLCDAEGKRLAKRDNAPALRDLQAAGAARRRSSPATHLLVT